MSFPREARVVGASGAAARTERTIRLQRITATLPRSVRQWPASDTAAAHRRLARKDGAGIRRRCHGRGRAARTRVAAPPAAPRCRRSRVHGVLSMNSREVLDLARKLDVSKYRRNPQRRANGCGDGALLAQSLDNRCAVTPCPHQPVTTGRRSLFLRISRTRNQYPIQVSPRSAEFARLGQVRSRRRR